MKCLWLLLIMSMFSFIGNSQSKNDLSAETSINYGFGKYFNNRSASICIKYNLFDFFRITSSYSFFIPKAQKKMSEISFNFHYLFSDKNSNIIPVLKNQGLYYYPILGFNVVNTTRSTHIMNRSNYSYAFGFNGGVGVEYELPTLQNVFRDMAVNFEFQYIAVDKMYRPFLRFGLVYYFKLS